MSPSLLKREELSPLRPPQIQFSTPIHLIRSAPLLPPPVSLLSRWQVWTQFTIVTTDKVQATTNSLIGGLNVGDPLTVTIVLNPNPFLVDTKGLQVSQSFPATFNNFASGTTTTAIHLGQAVAVNVTTFTSASSFEVQTFLGTPGTRGITNLEGVTDINLIDDTKPIAIRALYLENTTFTAAPVFFAAKVRQH